MAVINSGGSVEIDAAGVASINNFTSAEASNIKVQNNCLYTITTGAVGSATTGNILLRKTGSVANLESNHTFVVQQLRFTANDTSSDPAQAGVHINFKGAKVYLTTGGMDASQIAPFKGNAQSQFIFKGGGTTWNAKYPDVEIDGSTFIYEGGGDGNFCKSPLATVKNVTMLWTSTSPSLFVLGMQQSWLDSNKPDAWRGFTLQSIKGNYLVAPFSWSQNQLTNLRPNNAFQVMADFSYNVSPVGTRPTALRRSYRRNPNLAMPTSYWGAVTVNMTYLWIDLNTTLSSTGEITTTKTYLRNVDYIAGAGTNAGETGDDILTVRFEPTFIDPVGNKLADVSAVITNTNAATSYANAIGNLNAKLAASGITAADGQFIITEPATKDYTSNASHRTDSITIRNRVRTQAWHKWWEGRAKLIPICDSRSTTGVAVNTGYAATDYAYSYRRAGSVFDSGAFSTATPFTTSVTLTADVNYNTSSNTSGITVTYSSATGVTTLALPDGSITLDRMHKALVDFHANPDNNEAITTVPMSFVPSVLTYSDKLSITGTPLAIIVAGEKVKTLATTQTASFNTAGNPTIQVPYVDALGSRAQIFGLDPEEFGITWHLRYKLASGSTWTNISGTGNTAVILVAQDTYDVQIRAPGYDWESALSLDTTVSLSLNAVLRYQVSSNNTPQYTMTYDAVLEAIFQYDATAMKVSVSNTTAGILQPGFAELYRATQRIQHIPALVWVWTAPVTANATSQKILIPSGNPISMYLTDASTNTVKITCPVIHADTGQSADDRVRGNPSGYSIILGSPATAESAGLQSAIVSDLLAKLGGTGFVPDTHSLVQLTEAVDAVPTVAEIWSHNDRTLTTAPGLTPEQAADMEEIRAKAHSAQDAANAVWSKQLP